MWFENTLTVISAERSSTLLLLGIIMTEMYKILGTIGWIWMAVFTLLLIAGLLVQRARWSNQNPPRGFEVKVNGSNEKQS